uniref:Uncharacterized protein n=2 Tax=Kalmanozyma brasiliensis (strain GHG001) TaxID=1365824 RepID=V5EUX3_KALBG
MTGAGAGTSFVLSSFPDAMDDASALDGLDDDEAYGAEAFDGPDTGARLATALPALDLDKHADPSDLDEQLAKLFLASSGNPDSADFAKLEAFLESEDPSWPGPAPEATFNTGDTGRTFEDDFDDFLPFQSASSTAADPGSLPSADVEDLPSMDDISQMQDRLFGANAAARLEAGPLGMGTLPNGSGDGDLASQLSQLQWHAQRVRNIQDPDQRRKEAALVALAFSMQWSNGEDAATPDAGTMAF